MSVAVVGPWDLEISASAASSPPPPYRAGAIESLHELRRLSEHWDDLWRRSDVAAPSIRAELIAQWAAQFAPRRRFCGVTVEHDGWLVAALPLVARRVGGVSVGALPSNEWSISGDLLLDPEIDVDRALDALVAVLPRLGWPLLWLDQAPYEAPRWQAFQAALARAGLRSHVKPQFRIGQVELADSWEAYEATRNGDHRRSRQRYSRLLEKAGPTRLAVHGELTAAGAESLLRLGFEIEDRSWKSEAGTSVLQTPGMFDFYARQAAQLAAWGQLELVFLEHDGEPIAFDYGWRSKGVHFLCKLGYDDAFRKFGPGQQMLMRLLERLHSAPDRRLLDFWGPLVPWNESWSTRTYPVGRLVIGATPLAGRLLLHAYDRWFPRLKRLGQSLKRKLKPSAAKEPTPAAE